MQMQDSSAQFPMLRSWSGTHTDGNLGRLSMLKFNSHYINIFLNV
jgi:hypothetical protein